MREAVALIAAESRGIPRIINKLCFRSLLEGYARGCSTISADIVEKAQRNLNFAPPANSVHGAHNHTGRDSHRTTRPRFAARARR